LSSKKESESLKATEKSQISHQTSKSQKQALKEQIKSDDEGEPALKEEVEDIEPHKPTVTSPQKENLIPTIDVNQKDVIISKKPDLHQKQLSSKQTL
jgi:hypothetical protein